MAVRTRTTKKKNLWSIIEQLDTSPLGLLKITGLVLVGFVLLALVIQMFGFSARSVSTLTNGGRGVSIAPSAGYRYASDDSYAAEEAAYTSVAQNKAAYDGASLSLGGITPVPSPGTPVAPGTTGDTAEEFEVTEYSAFIETRDSMHTCSTISDLKVLDYVIFERANEHDRGCNYTFKVTHERVASVLAVLEQLDPKELSEYTYTIKSSIDHLTSETEILEKKLAAIDETLESSLRAYEEITDLATVSRDAGSLAQIIDSKVQLIERLTQERIRINERLDRISQARADQLDRLVYTYFNVDVRENKYVDGEQLKDSWQRALQAFVHDINSVIQNVTVNLIVLFFVLAQYILYLLILVFVGKRVWQLVRYIWKKM